MKSPDVHSSAIICAGGRSDIYSKLSLVGRQNTCICNCTRWVWENISGLESLWLCNG